MNSLKQWNKTNHQVIIDGQVKGLLAINSLFFEAREYALSQANAFAGSSSEINKSLETLREMMSIGIAPYRNMPREDRTWVYLVQKGQECFPDCQNYSTDLALALHDWTSASFTRMQFFSYFRYGNIRKKSNSIDRVSIANLIWGASWGLYTRKNADYMWSFTMLPSFSERDIYRQLIDKEAKLLRYSYSQLYLINYAIAKLAGSTNTRIPTSGDTQNFYSGQPDVFNMSVEQFFAIFEELPANNDPNEPPLKLDRPSGTSLLDCIKKFFNDNSNGVTLKGVIATTNSESSAVCYSRDNGLLIKFFPPDGTSYWPTTAYVTPFSNETDKVEYLFQIASKFKCIEVHNPRDMRCGDRTIRGVIQIDLKQISPSTEVRQPWQIS